jgi:hypothetical protein
MATVQEQAIEWIHQALKFDEPTEQEIVALVPSIPLELAGMPYCEACESVLCGACGHCHMLDVIPFSRPECPNDNDDMWVITFFRPVFPAKVPTRSGRGLKNAVTLVFDRRESTIPGHFHTQRNQGRPLCSVMRQWSSQPTKLSGDFDRKTCRDPNFFRLSGKNGTKKCYDPDSAPRV